MSTRLICGIITLAALVAGLSAWQRTPLQAQPAGAAPLPAANVAKDRFDFEVIESFDAQYLGDTPGHSGRNGGLGDRRPHLSLGDAVYRGDEQVGTLTQIRWDRTRGSLDLEFDPVPLAKVFVGDVVWVSLGNGAAKPTP